MHVLLETERLVLRQLTDDDAAKAYAAKSMRRKARERRSNRDLLSEELTSFV